MKVIDTLWFTNINGTAGIVIIEEDVTGDRKAYIGAVPVVVDEKRDTEAIIAWGNKLSLRTLKRIEHFLKKGNGKTETLDNIIEELADKFGIYGIGSVEGAHPADCKCRICFCAWLKGRIEKAVD